MISSQNETTTSTIFESTVIPCSVDEPKTTPSDCFTGISLGGSFEVSRSYQPLRRSHPPYSLVNSTAASAMLGDMAPGSKTDSQPPYYCSTSSRYTQQLYDELFKGSPANTDGRRHSNPASPRATIESLVKLEMEVADLEHQLSAAGCGLHQNSVPATLLEIERILDNFQSDHQQRIKRALDITETKVGVLTTLCKRMVGTTIIDPNQAAECCRELSAVRPLAPLINMAANNLRAIETMEQEWETIREGVADTLMKMCCSDDEVGNHERELRYKEGIDEVDGPIPDHHKTKWKYQVLVDKENLDALEQLVEETEEMLISTRTTLLKDFDSFEEKILNKRRTLLM